MCKYTHVFSDFMQEKFWRRSWTPQLEVKFEFETGDCKNITISLYRTPATIFLPPLISNCLFSYVNFWSETQASGYKKIAASLWYGLATSFLQPLVSN